MALGKIGSILPISPGYRRDLLRESLSMMPGGGWGVVNGGDYSGLG